MDSRSVVEEEDIDKRNAGCGAFIGDLLYIWGGRFVPFINSISKSA